MSDLTPKEIRECYAEYRDAWKETRDDAATDMQTISTTGPWTQDDRASRENNHRPCIHLDQINQFLNQVTGNVRKAKRAVKVIPKGEGANDADAAKRSSLIMGIEEHSKAQPTYLHAFQCQIERSYGFSLLRTEHKDQSSFDQEILIKPVLNPDTILISPHYKQPDASDIPDGFFLDLMPKKKYKQRFPTAKAEDFAAELNEDTSVTDWIRENYIQVAEFWRIEYKRSKLYLVESATGDIVLTQEKWEEIGKPKPKRERDVESPNVFQYLTNGVEILDKIPWAGSRIPIISCLGPERWTSKAGVAKRELLSMVRFARDPQMLYDFLATQECEEAKMVPKAPFVGAKGQFESDQDAWESVSDEPHAFLQYDPVTDATGQQTLPPPSRPQYQPNFQQYELAKDSAGRSLQAAMGITPLPDAAQRRNQKSGVALEKIDNMESLGSFHFVDRYENCFLHNMGWQLNELITPILDTQREIPISKPDGKRDIMHTVGNTSHPLADGGTYEVQGLPIDHLHTGKGDFDVTISTGPAEDSEREEQGDFVDQMIENLANLPQPGTPSAKILALGIRMRPTLGPIGQQMADIFDPPDPSNLPPEAQAIVSQLQGQIQQLTQENQALHMDRAGRVLEQQTKMALQEMKEKGENMRAQLANDIKVLIAETTAKTQHADQQLEMYKAFWLENHGAAHEAGMQAVDHAHEHSIADKQAQIASAQQATQIAADQQAQESPAQST